MPKKSAAELREELRGLRKEKMKPISKMKMGDISAEIERLRMARETTPAVDAVPSVPMKKMESAVKSIKEAKAAEFPMKPSAEVKSAPATKTGKKAPVAPVEKKKMGMKDKLAKMLAAMDDEESE